MQNRPSGRSAAAAAVAAVVLLGLFGNSFGCRVVDGLFGGDGDEAAALMYTCSMHPQVVQEGPGECPICRMALTPMETGAGGADGQAHDHDHDAAGTGDDLHYTCSMHPQVVQEGPGDCPICGMDLTPLETDSGTAGGHDHGAAGGGDDLHYTCSMHPQVVQEGPGDCPICGMALTPLETDPAAGAGGSGGGAAGLPARRSVRVDPGFLQRFGVRTTPAERGSLPIGIRTVGYLAHNEENLFAVNTKFSGWIEKARFNTVGERVTAGEVLFEIYSPELVTTQQEYLLAREYVERLRERGAYADAITRAESLLDAARERLRYWDTTDRQIAALEATGLVSRTIEFVSPVSGFVVEKSADSLEGMRLDPGKTILKIADHSVLWAEVAFYEHDVRHLREGQRVTVTVDAFPGRAWNGSILFFRPAMNPGTRTLTAFVEVGNADLQLRPRMFANIEARIPGVSDAVLVPGDAVLHSGARAVVIVADGGGRFTPREVRLGLSQDGRQQVLEGLDAGEEIVVSSQFLIDSESNLRAAIDQLLGGGS